MKASRLLFPALVAALAACRPAAPAAEEPLVHTDFDSLVGWVPDAATLRTEQAHSGSYAVRVDEGHEFGLTCNRMLGEASSRRLLGVHVEAWAYRTGEAGGARLGIIVSDPTTNTNVVDAGVDLEAQLPKPGQWYRVQEDITFPPTVQYQHRLTTFLWRSAASAPVYLDDLTITGRY
ncbi:hypothetical protein [Hymenobacter guriensis]|uniref:CBM-cenC domain-containing protein n=1 Tax=Hymenobacter guriensis TaxID=2793065 RepID=A0ABS0L2S7_9BACT|nr:hypothetical protein [Hymenobacter guriensis]MBG8554412.1 hypothetical protein [Hymenobacter guriensis]